MPPLSVVFLFLVKGGVFSLNSVETLKMSDWRSREFLSSSADTGYYNIHCDVVHCLFSSSKLNIYGGRKT